MVKTKRWVKGDRLTPTELAVYWFARQNLTTTHFGYQSVREQAKKRYVSYLTGSREISVTGLYTATQAYYFARHTIHLEDRAAEKQKIKELAYKRRIKLYQGNESANEAPADRLIGLSCVPYDNSSCTTREGIYHHLEQLTCKIISVNSGSNERIYTVEVVNHPAIAYAGQHWRKNSLKGSIYTFRHISLLEPLTPERRCNTVGRRAVETARKYRIAWLVIGGAVVIPGTARTYDYRLRLRGAGCKWDRTRKAWIA